MGIANALVYLFNCDILHKHGHRYHLSCSIQTEYLIKHPQIPPDVVKGENTQSHASDVYTFGRVLKAVNQEKLNIPLLHSLSDLCMDLNPFKRPAQNILTSLQNLS